VICERIGARDASEAFGAQASHDGVGLN